MQTNMTEENISQVITLKNKFETSNYFIEEIKQNDLMTTKHKNVSTALIYLELSLILLSAVTGCISVPAFDNWLVFQLVLWAL